MSKFTAEQIKKIAILGGWKHHEPSKPLPMYADSDAKHFLTYRWETPEGLGSVDGPKLDDLNVVMDIINRYCDTNNYRVKIEFRKWDIQVCFPRKSNGLKSSGFEEVVEFVDLANCLSEGLLFINSEA